MSSSFEESAGRPPKAAISIRTVNANDAAEIWRLVERCETLDKNSCYAYLLLCSDFADTCLAAFDGLRLVGVILGYRPPSRKDTLFVWQVGVEGTERGRGLGKLLLATLANREIERGTRFLEATVTPGNNASKRLFSSFAASRECELVTSLRFPSNQFAGLNHDDETLIRIGPL